MKKGNLKYSLVLPTRLSFSQQKLDIVNDEKSGFGEKNRMDCLIIIDDVSGIAENLQKI